MKIDRILSLDDAASYPGRQTVDMVVYLGCFRGQTVRLWLLTAAAWPTVRIDEHEFEPAREVGEGEGPLRWLDLGVTDRLNARFGQLRIEGMTIAEARESKLLITRDLDLRAEGALEDVEEAVFGISRRNAGRTTLSPSRGEVGESVSFELTYTAGPHGLPGGAMVRFAVPRAFSAPQMDDPEAPGFMTVRAVERDGEAAPVRIESADLSEDGHEEVDVICLLTEGLEPGGRIVVNYRTEEMYIFPWKREAVERQMWFAHLAPLAAAVAVDERRRWVELPHGNSHSFETLPGPAERLHLVLPGRVHEDEEVSLHGIFTDRFRNVPGPRGIPSHIKLTIVDKRGEREIGTPRGRFEAAHRFRMPLGTVEKGLYRIRAWDADTGDMLAQSNPMVVLDDDDDRPNVYWGEIHGHTEMSDGSGGFEEMFRHARDEGRQDFAAAADHACYFTDNEWEWMQDVVNSYNERGDFVTLLGYEWAGRQGHRCIYAKGRSLKLFRGMCEGEDTLDVVYEHFHEDDEVVAGPHHTGANGRMQFHDPETERFIEIYSMWGASDRIGAPKAPLFPGKNPLPAHEWLNRGAMLGFTGGGDCHEGRSGWTPDDPRGQGSALHAFARQLRYRCGLTAAPMPELRRRHLIDALRERKTWATTGARILLEFEASGVPMGDEGEADEIEVRARVHGVQELSRLEIIRDGDVVWTEEIEGLDAELEWSDPEPAEERTWLYLHVIQRDGEEAWSSPVWLNGRDT
ncbi:MAG: CehA/McbA family metallohydrolase [Armatimonadota bacterium]